MPLQGYREVFGCSISPAILVHVGFKLLWSSIVFLRRFDAISAKKNAGGGNVTDGSSIGQIPQVTQAVELGSDGTLTVRDKAAQIRGDTFR